MIKKCFVSMFLVFICCACILVKQVEEGIGGMQLAPGQCFIEGCLLGKMPADTSLGGLCAKYSCRGRIRIDKILDCAAPIGRKLQAGDTLMVDFPHTLYATHTILPTLTTHNLGMEERDRFRSIIRAEFVFGGKLRYYIYHYSVIY